MRRYFPGLVLTGALLTPLSAWPLGLGEIRVNSALNQPFDAEIELISPTPEELASLKVGLASSDLFARYNIERPAYLSSFDFSVGRSRDGRATIRVRSSRSITEPFITLLVEASWARGRLVREYTVLLDPPVYMPAESQAAAPVTTPQAGAQTDGRIERSTVQPEPQQLVTETSSETSTATERAAFDDSAPALSGQYTVQRNDTLWRIASQVTSGSPRQVNRTMIALYRANPHAFDGNINRLRAGAVLRIPELAEIEAISASEAAQEVARHAAEWGAALEGSSVVEAGRLRLVTPEESTAAPSATPATDEPADVPASTTAPTQAAQEDRRLQVESPDLAGMQQGVDDAPLADEPLVPEGATAEQLQEPPAATEQAEQTPAQAVQPRPQPTPVSEESESPSILDRLAQFWWLIIALGVLALVFIFVRRRREESSLDSLDASASPAMDYEPGRRAAKSRAPEAFQVEEGSDVGMAASSAGVAATQAVAEPPVPESELASLHAAEPEPTAPAQASLDDTLSSETAIRLDQQDALAEADFHMAYGLYDQAADLVKIALEREPSRRDLKLKLLEIYFVWGNRELFLETARELEATRAEAAPGEWDKIVIMGKQIAPDDPLFQGESTSADHADLVDVNLEGGENRVDVDLFAEPGAEQAVDLDFELVTGEHKAPAGDDLDFLLDESEPAADSEPTREIDPLARTQETPTIESPILERQDDTVRVRTDTAEMPKLSVEQTAEISLDDLGLDAEAIDHSGSLEDTTSLEKESVADTLEGERPLGDDEMTQLAPSLGSWDRTMQAPHLEQFDPESTGTIYLDQVDLSGGNGAEQPASDIDATATMKSPSGLDLDLGADTAHANAAASNDTVQQPRLGNGGDGQFSHEVFSDGSAQATSLDFDLGEALVVEDDVPRTEQTAVTEMDLSELEPVTMSEVGTKLDLARAYMDMGDPDGARSILEEVLQEGNESQKQEANRLLESIR